MHNATPGAVCFVSVPDIVGMLAHLNLESLTAVLDKQIAAKANDRIALTFEQRQTQSSQIMNELFEAELNEATLTLQAWEGGLPIEANPSIGPASWLAVHNVVAAACRYVDNAGAWL